MQLLGCIAYFVLYVLISLLEIGACTYTNAIVHDYEAIMKDVEAHTRKSYGANTSRETDPYIRHSFKEAVNLHAEMLEYFHYFQIRSWTIEKKNHCCGNVLLSESLISFAICLKGRCFTNSWVSWLSWHLRCYLWIKVWVRLTLTPFTR